MQKKTEMESQAEREAARKEREFLITERTAVDTEKHKLLEDRKLIAQQLHRMIQFIQPTPGTSPHNTAAAVSIGETHPITPADLTIPPRRHATQDSTTSDESTSRKRPRTEVVTSPSTIPAPPPLNTSQVAAREPAPTPSTLTHSPPMPTQSPTCSSYAPLNRTLTTLPQRARGLPSRGTPRSRAGAPSPFGVHPSPAPAPMSPTRDPRRPFPP
ncbi:hypothetical protein B0H11DRAFT_2272239 [Mycena galericulata]|nr:hypothetical protein B0H11DRAFT_2272239 [Mycena galericulata]